MTQDLTRAACIAVAGLLIGVAGLVGGLWWAIHSAVDQLDRSIDQAATRITGQMQSLSTEVSRPIERMFVNPVPVEAASALPVTLPQPLVVGAGNGPLRVDTGAEPVPIVIARPVVVQGERGERHAVPVETDLDLLGGDNSDQ